MTNDDWVDVQIRTSIDAGELLGLLDNPAVQGSWEENGTLHLYWPRHSWGSQLLSRLQEVLTALDPDHAQGCIAPKSGNEPDGRRCSSRPLKVAKVHNPCR